MMGWRYNPIWQVCNQQWWRTARERTPQTPIYRCALPSYRTCCCLWLSLSLRLLIRSNFCLPGCFQI